MFSATRIVVSFVIAMTCAASVFAAPAPSSELEARVNHNGQATWFEVGLGACGKTNIDSDAIVAISSLRWNGGANCGQSVAITNTKTGKVTHAIVADECPECSNGSLDLSPSTFKSLASLDDGVFPITWHFLPRD